MPLTLFSPLAGAALATTTVAFALSVRWVSRMPEVFLGALGISLLGYALLGRGFAYLGAPPFYVGEIVLVVGLLTLLLRGAHRELFRSPVSWALCSFMLLGALASLPHLGAYGLDVLRDGALWGYGLFALLAASFLLTTDSVLAALRKYARFTPWFLFWAPVAFLIRGFVEVPTLPGSDVPILSVKPGDTAVHLAGTLTFLLLGLHRTVLPGSREIDSVREWFWWAFWLAGAALVFSITRGGMLAAMVAMAIVLMFRPASRWGKLLLVALLLGIGFVVSGLELRHSDRRPLSAETLMENVTSILPNSDGMADRAGTTRWRLLWWNDIIDYTIFGEYFWTGKGFGINLAADDGYLTSAGNNRSPHNGHLTVLARSGVPGLVAWALLLVTFSAGLLRSYFLARRRGSEAWARVHVWVLAYWSAFLVNGAFDVFLEGPQGGIWFWSLMGFGVALMRTEASGLGSAANPG